MANSFRLSHFEPRWGQSHTHSGHFIDGNPVISFNFQRVSKFLSIEILFSFWVWGNKLPLVQHCRDLPTSEPIAKLLTDRDDFKNYLEINKDLWMDFNRLLRKSLFTRVSHDFPIVWDHLEFGTF